MLDAMGAARKAGIETVSKKNCLRFLEITARAIRATGSPCAIKLKGSWKMRHGCGASFTPREWLNLSAIIQPTFKAGGLADGHIEMRTCPTCKSTVTIASLELEEA